MPRTPWKCHPREACIAQVLPESIAEELGLLPGDVISSVNGEPLTDYIAYRFAVAEEFVTLKIARDGETAEVEIEKDADDDLGIVFAGDVFDGVRACRNRCIFCFEEQMPAGMRLSLRLRDDDYRLSFLHGNFLTLTNLRDGDMARIIREHLSPLFVSIHATDPEIRRAMLRNRRAPDIRKQLRVLGEGGIEVHGQIVLCPGWNDGAVLAQTLRDLLDLHPPLETVGIVPVGLTGHRAEQPEVQPVTPEVAAATLDIVDACQRDALDRLGTRFVFAADELYLAAGRPLPPAAEYEGYPQKENGIGLARIFLDEVAALTLSPRQRARLSGVTATVATGTLAAPLAAQLAESLQKNGCTITVVPIVNQFYGGAVSVAGLLTGSDLLAGLSGRNLGQLLILPAASLNADGVFLDDTTPDTLAAHLGVPIRFCATPRETVDALTEHNAGTNQTSA